jgi:hypothetical protein
VVAVFAAIAFKSRNIGCSTPPIREAKMADIQHISEARDIAEREVARTLRREKSAAQFAT